MLQGIITTASVITVLIGVSWPLCSAYFSAPPREEPAPLGGPDGRGVFLILPGIILGVVAGIAANKIQQVWGTYGSVGVGAFNAAVATAATIVVRHFRRRRARVQR